MSSSGQAGKSAFDWDVYKNRRTALQHLRRNFTHIDTILQSEDGSAFELVHSQVMSAFGDKLTDYISKNGSEIEYYEQTVAADLLGDSSTPSGWPVQKTSEPPPLLQQPQPQQAQRRAPAQPRAAPNVASKTLASKSVARTPTSIASRASSWLLSDIIMRQLVDLESQPAQAAAPSVAPTITAAVNAATTTTGHSWRPNEIEPNKIKMVRLAKVSAYALGVLVECAYTGVIKTDLQSGGIWQVLEVAEHYEMSEVVRACCNFLSKSLNRSNCVHFYHVGLRHRNNLSRCAISMVRANFKHILVQNELFTYQQSHSSALAQMGLAGVAHQLSLVSRRAQAPPAQQAQVQAHGRSCRVARGEEFERKRNNLATLEFQHFESLLHADKLNVDNEESVWFAIKLWCNYDLAARAHKVARLLPCMRFPRFRHGTEFSANYIWRDPLVLGSPEAQHTLAVLDRNHRDFLNSLPGLAFRDGFNLLAAGSPRQLRPRVPHSVLLAIGGWQGGHPTQLIESYDMNCNLWFESDKRMMSALAYHGIEFVNGLLYVCGGTDGTEILNELFTLDPVSGECRSRPSMRESRCYVSTAQLAGHLYAMGGHNGVQRMKSVERFDLANESWSHLADMNVARSDASACVFEGRVYIAGGLNDQLIEASVEFYSERDNSWTFIQSMLTPRTSFSLVPFGGRLLAIGGNSGSERLASVEQFDPEARLWSRHSDMCHRRSTFSAALLEEGKLMVVGGYNGQAPFSQVEMYDELQGAWTQMQRIKFDRSGLRVVVVRDLPNARDYTFLGSALAGAETAH